MRNRLPPIFSLQTFEAAARLGNFTRAANELNLTPGAISRQIRQLEDLVYQTLFERNGSGMRLTLEGRDLMARLGGPLAALHEAVYRETEEAHPTLQIATLGSLARAWLLPRLGGLISLAPNVRLIVQTDYALVRPPPRLAMVAIRYGLESDGGELLFDDRLVAVATPELSSRFGTDPIHWPNELILSHLTGDSSTWFKQVGYHAVPTGPACNDAGVTVDAALAGLGMTVTRLSLILPLLALRQLVLVHPLVLSTLRSNRLLIREDSAGLPVVMVFSKWIRAQAAQTAQQILAFDEKSHMLTRPRA